MEEPRKKRVLPIIGLVLVAILVVSLASYAYWPITDEEGSETTPNTFTITNNCDDPINYQVALE